MVFSSLFNFDEPIYKPSPVVVPPTSQIVSTTINSTLNESIKADIDSFIVKNNLNKGEVADYIGKKPLIIHCCHHKTGTVVIEKVLRVVCQQLNLKYQYCPQSQLESDTDVWMQHHSHVDFTLIDRPVIGTHMVRNPCAIVVSAYEYHKNTIEPWANRKIKSMDGLSYREILNKLDMEEGVIFEMKNDFYVESSRNTIMDMYNWDYRRPNFLELKFEDLMTNYDATLANMFKHYGFTRDMINTSLMVASKYNLRNKKEEDVHNNKHVTNKNMDLEKWKEYFSIQEIAKRFWKIFPEDIFKKIGYNDDNLTTLTEQNILGKKTKALMLTDEQKILMLKEKLWKTYGGETPLMISDT